jgi:hypothetical protein
LVSFKFAFDEGEFGVKDSFLPPNAAGRISTCVGMNAISAIEQACWDILGNQSTGLSINSSVGPCAIPSGCIHTSAVALKCNRRWRMQCAFCFQHSLRSKHADGLLCRDIYDNRAGIRHSHFSQRDL